jgi:hypothetical protein
MFYDTNLAGKTISVFGLRARLPTHAYHKTHLSLFGYFVCDASSPSVSVLISILIEWESDVYYKWRNYIKSWRERLTASLRRSMNYSYKLLIHLRSTALENETIYQEIKLFSLILFIHWRWACLICD